MSSVSGKKCLMALLKREVRGLNIQTISYDTLVKGLQMMNQIEH